MAQVIVRNLEKRVVDTLKKKAALHGHSLEQELREILDQAAKLGAGERAAVASRIRALSPVRTHPSDSTHLIRQDRDR